MQPPAGRLRVVEAGAEQPEARPVLVLHPVVVADGERAVLERRLDEDVAFARADLASLPLRRVAHSPLMERCWELRSNMTVYDAAYVALAEALDTRLLTADAKLAATPGPTCAIELFAP